MALTKSDFEKMVLEPGIVRVMHESGVNVDVLAEMLDLVLGGRDGHGPVPYIDQWCGSHAFWIPFHVLNCNISYLIIV